jgi:glycine/D-amino acid oxidase-like deaminating enzyme
MTLHELDHGAHSVETDVLIVGGGIVGCATAYYLARAGAEVVVVERGDWGAEASGANGGSLHAQLPSEEFAALGEDWAATYAPTLRLLKAAVEHWRGLEAEIGQDLEVKISGGLIVAETEVEMSMLARKTAVEHAYGLEAEILSGADLRSFAPYVSEHFIGAEFCPTEGKASSLLATPALAGAAKAAGARMFRGTKLVALRRERAGFEAETSRGVMRAARVVDAAGGEAGCVAAMLGVPLAVEGYPIHMNVTEPTSPLVTHLLYSAAGRLTIKQAANGTVLIGGGWPAARYPANGHPAVLRASIEGNLWVALKAVPRLAGLELVRTWAGVVSGTADWKPILGEVPGVPGFFLGVVPWTGFTAGPLCGRLLSDLMCGREPGLDLVDFSPLGE